MIEAAMAESKTVARKLARDRFGIQGQIRPGFEAVDEAFTENFVRRGELGGACCAYYRGEKVVDLWGGIRNRRRFQGTSRPCTPISTPRSGRDSLWL